MVVKAEAAVDSFQSCCLVQMVVTDTLHIAAETSTSCKSAVLSRCCVAAVWSITSANRRSSAFENYAVSF